MPSYALDKINRFRWTLAIASVAAACAAVYGQTVLHDFVDLDDGLYVVQNPHVLQGLSWKGLGWAFSTLRGGFYIPLTWISLMLDQTLFGPGPWGFHLTNLILHAANSLLVLLVLFSTTRAFGASLVCALVFAVHPLHVESVAWISERKDVLFAFFFLLALWTHARQAACPDVQRKYRLWLLCACALASKPMAVTLPAALLLLDYWPLGRFGPGRESLHDLLMEKAPLFAMCACSAAVTLAAQTLHGGVRTLAQIPLSARFGNGLHAYAAYVQQFFWPRGLAVFYPHPYPRMDIPVIAASALFLALVCLGAVLWRRRAPWLFTGWFFFLIVLAPVSGLFQSGLQAMADRFMYMPLLGLTIAVVWGARQAGRRRAPAPLMGGLALAAVTGLALAAHTQAGWWKDSLSLYGRTLAVTKDNFMVHEYMGASLAAKGRYGEAAGHFEAALRINPGFADAHCGLGEVAVNRGLFAKSLAHFQTALACNPGHVESYYGLGTALMHLGRYAEARFYLRKALSLDPGHGPAAENLSIVQGRL